MFVLSASQMNKLEDHAFKNGYQAADLMEQAAINRELDKVFFSIHLT